MARKIDPGRAFGNDGPSATASDYRGDPAVGDDDDRFLDDSPSEDVDHPINFNVGKIAGGDWASSVPAWCSFDCRIAVYPGVPAREAAVEIEDCLRACARDDPFLSNAPPEIEWNGFHAEGYTLEEGSDAEAALASAHARAHGGELESMVTPGYLDGRVFVLYAGMPCLVYGPVSQNIHAFDERVSLSSIKRVTGTLALFIADWCGLEPV